MTGAPLRGSLLALLLLASPVPEALADTIHLKNGSAVSVDRWWEQDGEIRYHRAGGIIGIPRNQIVRIEASPGTAGPRGTAPAGAPNRITPGSARAVPPPAAPAAPTGAAAAFNTDDPSAWRERLKVIEPAIGRPGVNEASARREAAILYTLLGNEAARSGDLDGAESSYRLATDKDPNLPAPILNLARVRMTQGRNSEAEGMIQDALVLRPEEPTALALLGEIAYRSDRIPEAIDLWEKSLRKEADPLLSERLEKARRQLSAEQDFLRSDAPHFTLKYDGDKSPEALSQDILDHLESRYADLTSRYNVYPASVIIVTLYSRNAFYDVTQSPRWVGGLFDGQIRIPIGGLTRLTGEARSVLTHELTHCIVYHKTRNNCPKWLQEGIAQHEEGKTGRLSERDLSRKYAHATAADLAADFSYPLSLSLVEHFLRTFSPSHLLDLLDALGHGSDIDAAFQTSTGESYDDFLESWIREMASKEGAR